MASEFRGASGTKVMAGPEPERPWERGRLAAGGGGTPGSPPERKILSGRCSVLRAKVPAIYMESADEPYPPVPGSEAEGQRPQAF